MRKSWMIFSLLCCVIFSLSCFAATQQTPNPYADPKVKQEEPLVNYVLDAVQDYVESVDWITWNPPEDNRADTIGKIIQKYGYSEDYYGVNISSLGEPNNGIIYYYIVDTCIFYHANSDLSTCQKLIVEIEPVPPKGEER